MTLRSLLLLAAIGLNSALMISSAARPLQGSRAVATASLSMQGISCPLKHAEIPRVPSSIAAASRCHCCHFAVPCSSARVCTPCLSQPKSRRVSRRRMARKPHTASRLTRTILRKILQLPAGSYQMTIPSRPGYLGMRRSDLSQFFFL